VLTWNLFHGRSVPPAGRALGAEFARALAAWDWQVALLQEVPPWWPPLLAVAAGAEHRQVLTSRNAGLALRRVVAERRPDLVRSNGGGCNALLARVAIAEHRALRLRRWPERRVAQLVRLADGTAIVNFHASTRAELAQAELARLWRHALGWAARAPMVLGGDLNLRQARAPAREIVHAAQRDVDHLFALGLQPCAPAQALDRTVVVRGRPLELSDHPPLAVTLVPDWSRTIGDKGFRDRGRRSISFPDVWHPPYQGNRRFHVEMHESEPTSSGTTRSGPDIEPGARGLDGRYEILEEIGRGAMGIVYKARQSDLDRIVALKRLHAGNASAPELVKRFVRESYLAGSLNHPNIVTIHDYIEDDGASYIAMEYLPRGSLRPWVSKLSLAQMGGVLEALLSGLAAVEPEAIVHRDLKPENVMVTADGRVKIADFGIAKATKITTPASFMTRTGTTVGTPPYMAPEQALGDEVGPWTDLYSVGVMTYENLVGRLPFHDSPTPVAILLRHINEPIPPVTDTRPDVDRSLSEWVARLLIKDPAERIQAAGEAWEELEEILLSVLGPRWRRDAPLSELGATIGTQPLTPAPFASRSVKDRGGSAARNLPTPAASPEAVSRFLSFGYVPTGIDDRQPGAMSSGQPFEGATVATHDGVLRNGQSAVADIATAANTRFVLGARARRLGVAVALVALPAFAGFLLAPSGGGTITDRHRGLTLAGARSPVPSRVYAVALSDAMSTLNLVRASSGVRLADASTTRLQAEAALKLARAHEQAAASIRDAVPGQAERPANAAIIAALSGVAKAYSIMAGAARREDRQRYDLARSLVSKETAALSTALAQLPALGYKISAVDGVNAASASHRPDGPAG
jgi:serine/threonine protein kinase/endonuclease/exonuclease/phosphatase family metal-dependent hydrolase